MKTGERAAWVLAVAAAGVLLAGSSVRAGDPTQITADQPSAWLVLYNLNDLDSVAWASWFCQMHSIPPANRLGLHAARTEHLATAQEARDQIFEPVRQYLRDNPQIEESLMGIVVGYGLPGHFGDGPFGIGGYSVSSALQDLSCDPLIDNNCLATLNQNNPHLEGRVLPESRLTKATLLPDHYLTVRIDGANVERAKQLSRRAWWLRFYSLVIPPLWGQGRAEYGDEYGGGLVYYDYQDPDLPNGEWYWLRQAVESDLLGDLPWQEFDSDTQQSPLGPFRFGSHDIDGWDDLRLRGEPQWGMILAYNLNSFGATTVRSIVNDDARYVPNALDAGYAAAIGSTAEPATVIAPFPDTILAGLLEGWTLGEVFYLSNPYQNFTWEVVGDPFLALPYLMETPRYGDFDADDDVDISDFNTFAGCYTGSNAEGLDGPCLAADFDGDGDVDIVDFELFAANFTGAR